MNDSPHPPPFTDAVRPPRPLWDEAAQADRDLASTAQSDVMEPGAGPGEGPGTGQPSAVDLFRGLTIVEVVLHHASGMALRSLPADTLIYEVVLLLNRTLHFAVPAFIFLSSMILSRSLLKRFDARRYYQRRLARGAWPYLLWSVIYVFWYVLMGVRPAASLLDAGRWVTFLLYGKASFHLYFLLVALQVYLILPLLRPLSLRKPGITATLLVGLAVQMLIFGLNAWLLHFPFPASTALWYVLAIMLGVSVGASILRFRRWWRERKRLTWLSLAAAFALYLPLALRYGAGEEVNAALYSASSWLYTSLMALALLGVSVQLISSRHALRRPLAWLGGVSLQVYLIHPMILQVLERLLPLSKLPALAVLCLTLLFAAAALILPALLGHRLLNTRLSVWLFGR